jgi:endonuclease/exonuclease/phosphatase (EEP) superfamily protein YafD
VCVSRLISQLGVKVWLVHMVCLLAGFVSLLSIVSLAGGFIWLCDLSSHFRLQYFVTLLLLLPVLVSIKRKRVAVLALVALSVNALEIAPFYLPRLASTSLVGARKLKIMTINVNYENKQFGKIIESINTFNPDLFAVEELTPSLNEQLKAKLPDYKYNCSATQMNPFGIGIFSRVPIEHSQVVYIRPGYPSIMEELTWDGKPLLLVATHPTTPLTPALAADNKAQLKALSELIKQKNESAVLIGDLNATSWCSAYKEAVNHGHLVDASRGFGLQVSWLRSFPPLCLPIDHCLTTPDMVATKNTIGEDIGSDHWPVYVELERKNPLQPTNLLSKGQSEVAPLQ